MVSSKERFSIYRRMFATADDGLVSWWYSGVSYVILPDQPEIPMSQISAIMTYRTETVSASAFRVHWSEIGVFSSPVTGEEPGPWTNPVTGTIIEPPKTFQEGPGVYAVYATDDGVRLELEQPSALVHELGVHFLESADRVGFLQHERKQRGYPRPDGSLPALESTAGLHAFTELGFFANRADLARPATADFPVQGTYRFTLSGIPPWMGFGSATGTTRTLGSITRARPGERLNPRAWGRMEAAFPLQIRDPPAARRTG